MLLEKGFLRKKYAMRLSALFSMGTIYSILFDNIFIGWYNVF